MSCTPFHISGAKTAFPADYTGSYESRNATCCTLQDRLSGPSRRNVALLAATTQGNMTRADLISILMNTELEEHPKLTREQARAVVSEIFEAIAEALRNGEDAHLPFGSLGVCEQDRKPSQLRDLRR